jgi:hypothetical protein
MSPPDPILKSIVLSSIITFKKSGMNYYLWQAMYELLTCNEECIYLQSTQIINWNSLEPHGGK